MSEAPNYITPEGFARLREELQKLLYKERPEIVKTVAWAASLGDRSENADYIYGKRRLREIDRRVRFLQKRLESARVVEPGTAPPGKIQFGARVTLADEEGKERTYRIVGVDESDPAKGFVSWQSPLARALMGKGVGDVVTIKRPKGDAECEILKVEAP